MTRWKEALFLAKRNPFLCMIVVAIVLLAAFSFIGVRNTSPGLVNPTFKQEDRDVSSLENLCPVYFAKHNWTVPSEPAPVWIPIGGRFQPPTNRPTVSRAQWRPKYCVIARTYAGQSPSSNMFSVDRFIASMLMQTFVDWELLILDTDPTRPFPYLTNNISEWTSINEPFRIRQVNTTSLATNPHAEEEITADSEAARAKQRLHAHVYWLTDQTISTLCSPEAHSFLATNGDNWYHPRFLEEVDKHLSKSLETGSQVDILGVDFFSRYATYIWGMPQRERTCSALQQFSPCICNGVVPQKSDLGSMVFNLTRWRAENQSFYNLSSDCVWGRADADACAAHGLRMHFNWTADRLAKCLFSHAPNPHLCTLYGGQTVHAPFRREEQEFECVLSIETARALVQEDLSVLEIGDAGSACYQAKRFNEPDDDGPRFLDSFAEPSAAGEAELTPSTDPTVANKDTRSPSHL